MPTAITRSVGGQSHPRPPPRTARAPEIVRRRPRAGDRLSTSTARWLSAASVEAVREGRRRSAPAAPGPRGGPRAGSSLPPQPAPLDQRRARRDDVEVVLDQGAADRAGQLIACLERGKQAEYPAYGPIPRLGSDPRIRRPADSGAARGAGTRSARRTIVMGRPPWRTASITARKARSSSRSWVWSTASIRRALASARRCRSGTGRARCSRRSSRRRSSAAAHPPAPSQPVRARPAVLAGRRSS